MRKQTKKSSKSTAKRCKARKAGLDMTKAAGFAQAIFDRLPMPELPKAPQLQTSRQMLPPVTY